jgi:hypothetical protein
MTATEASVDFAEDSTENNQPSSGELAQVSALANRLIQIESAKAKILEQVEKLDEEYDRIQFADLPGLMEAIGLKDFTLSSGETVVVKSIIKGGLPSESAIAREKDPIKRDELRMRFESGIAYLENHGAAALIKNYVSAEFGKDSSALASAAADALKSLGVDPMISRGVNPQSLNAWLKERLKDGSEVDADIFKLYSGTKAEVKSERKPSK